jgi:hypothetical protein
VRDRQELERERLRLTQALQKAQRTGNWFEPAHRVVSFNAEAAFRFRTGTSHTKQLILEIVGPNPSLLARKLSIEAVKPFRRWAPTDDYFSVCGYVQDVRTLVTSPEAESILTRIGKVMNPDRPDEEMLVA